MRSIVHEVLARYLGTDQYAFDTSPRERWPDSGFVPRAEGLGQAQEPGAELHCACQDHGELEPQN